jgi:hypothetical protein
MLCDYMGCEVQDIIRWESEVERSDIQLTLFDLARFDKRGTDGRGGKF